MSLPVEYPDGYVEKWKREEILDGKAYLAPRPTTDHIEADGNLTRTFKNYLWDKGCRFLPSPLIHFNPKDRAVPDGALVCNLEIIQADAIYGAPDLIIEILSPSTKRRDRGYKKGLYERYGVGEYWIVDVSSRSIDVYLLSDGRYYLDNVYQVLEDWELDMMDEEDRAEVKFQFKTHLFDDLIIDVHDVFKNIG
ncbi:MAG: Uma2 family endonuclease [Defluviitaleaceae bacterium]|nr:Uma2 family endonuclease [Defluviitaleaceae bacterium]